MPDPIPMYDAELLRALISYDPLTGEMQWRERPRRYFRDTDTRTAEQSCLLWNAKHAGKRAFNIKTANGYLAGGVLRKRYLAHRVAWVLHYGKSPEGLIDHISGDKTDNRIENLRDVSVAENHKNMQARSNNASGVSGVGWDKFNQKWRVRINADGRARTLGRFSTLEEATVVRKAAERAHGYHENHGRAAAIRKWDQP